MKYLSNSSEVKANIKDDNRQTNKQDKNNMPHSFYPGDKQEALCTWVPLFGMKHMLIIMIMFSTCLLSSSIKFCSAVSEKSQISQPFRSRGSHLVIHSAPKTQTWLTTLRSCTPSSFIEFPSAVSEEKLKISQSIRGKGGHLGFLISRKNTNLVEDFEGRILSELIYCLWLSHL